MNAPRHSGHTLSALMLLAAATSATAGTFADWLDTSTLGAELIYFQRHSDRYNIDDDRRHTLRNHRTVQTRLDFVSAYSADTIGVDLGMFTANDTANCCAPDHEFNFVPWRNPWEPDWSKKHARDGASLYRAHIKLRHDGWWGKFGYYQPEGPGVFGVNWSVLPGTLRGFEGGGQLDLGDSASPHHKLVFALQWANAYKAPWYREVAHFRGADNESRVDDMYSLGARFESSTASSARSVELAWGEARDFLQNAHLKLKYQRELSPVSSTALSYQLYATSDRVRGNDAGYFGGGRAWQHYLAWHGSKAPWSAKVEFTHSRAPSRNADHHGYFVYRLTGRYAGANGAYEPWWDNRSDWNHNRESAGFLSLARTLDDILPTPGFSAAFSTAYGRGGRVYGVSETLRESAWSIHLAYVVPSGTLKGTQTSLHYTRYDNHTRQPSWEGFKNLFQDERDLKFLVMVPIK
ncbi:chitoporin [Betaproteobacteria bacterium]|nr:chitoporin [Betaproteobacteria bacterium]GHU00476.1 chitoporin [Betaproteobacteria bacterium]GHU18282.1 chitoporin [Betaproteobacteria bacterium]